MMNYQVENYQAINILHLVRFPDPAVHTLKIVLGLTYKRDIFWASSWRLD